MRGEVKPGGVWLKEERAAVHSSKLWVLLAVFRGYRVAGEVCCPRSWIPESSSCSCLARGSGQSAPGAPRWHLSVLVPDWFPSFLPRLNSESVLQNSLVKIGPYMYPFRAFKTV